ncbi:pyrin-like isoform X2 [Seriola dumerili]|uniref:pyrin-like isoform X2 n=1 Tax=Seriola dumerili TaxID=41447 RepID=UPI000BBE994B|nr:pyrin-like isoform X2 [Seriola dumerili]
MGVELLLMETLEELSKCDFEKFKWLLSTDVMDGCKPIPKSHLEDAPRTETVSKMAQKYDDDLAVNLTIEILRKMNMNNTAQKLKNTHTGGKTAASSTSSSASAPAVAPATISAQQGGVVIAPTVSGSTAGSWNITINKA